MSYYFEIKDFIQLSAENFAEQGEGRRKADALQGRQRSDAEFNATDGKGFYLEIVSNTVAVKKRCLNTIRALCAEDCCAVVGISGGVGSAVTAALCAEALGRERVLGVLLPNCVQKDLDLAMLTVTSLGIPHKLINIMDAMGSLQRTLPFQPDQESLRLLAKRVRRLLLEAVGRQCHGRLVEPNALALSSRELTLLGKACGLSRLLLCPSRENH